MPRLHKVVEAVKEEFADAVANGGGIYAVGYCFGGKYALLLGAQEADHASSARKVEDEEQGKSAKDPVIKAGAIAHGGLFYLCLLDGHMLAVYQLVSLRFDLPLD